MANYHLRAALWQIPTMVAASHHTETDRLGTNAFEDVKTADRLGILLDQLDAAKAKFNAMDAPAAAPGAPKLDLFVVPEYYFTEDSSHHFVLESTKNKILEKLKNYSVKNPSLVIVPGTIAWKKRGDSSLRKFFNKSEAGDRAMTRQQNAQANTTVGTYQRLHADAIAKLKDLQDDDKPYWLAHNTSYVIHQGKVLLKYHKRNDGGEVSKAHDGSNVVWLPGVKECFFSAGGVEFGLQICAEIFGGPPLDHPVDIHLMIASSHPLRFDNARVHQSGFLMYCDAMLDPAVYSFAGGTKALVAPSVRAAYSPLSQAKIDARATKLQAGGKTADQAAATATRLGGQLNFYNLLLQTGGGA